VQGSLPHPLYLAQDRPFAVSFAPSRHSEMAVHVQAAWVIPAGKKMLVTIGGGPSVFSVAQSLVSGVRWSDAYPYDSVQVTGADSQDARKSAIGFNAGADVAYFFSKTVGVGGCVRYAAATAQLGGKSGSLSVDVGGFQAGFGLRIRIPAGPSAGTRPTPPRR